MGRIAKALMGAVLSGLLLTGSPALAGGKGNGPHGGQTQGTGAQGQWHEGLPPGSDRGLKQGWDDKTHPRGWTAGKGKKQGWGGHPSPKGIDKKQ